MKLIYKLFFSIGKDDVRPGLLFSHSSKHKAQMEKRKRQKDTAHQQRFKSIKKVQEERLEEGLSTAISHDNKGFSMLQKMGYKPGTSLGKQSQSLCLIMYFLLTSTVLLYTYLGLGWLHSYMNTKSFNLYCSLNGSEVISLI